MANSWTCLIPFTAHWKKWFASDFLWPRKVSFDYCKIKTPLGGWKKSPLSHQFLLILPAWHFSSMANCDKWSKVCTLVIPRKFLRFLFLIQWTWIRCFWEERSGELGKCYLLWLHKADLGVDSDLNYRC